MIEWLVCFLQGPVAGVISQASGFLGSVLLLWTSWRSVRIRKAMLDMDLVRTDDSTLREVAMIVLHKLTTEQVQMIRGERRLYRIGLGLLATGFLLAFGGEVSRLLE
jgi:hypothetical protein